MKFIPSAVNNSLSNKLHRSLIAVAWNPILLKEAMVL